ncbi:hypothetical protein CK203_052732 [Vitis vinifera]|uniref:Uncharacterized protein n=1 Tax=Vitis vinifera TaxID=29760 RepID=A0A438GCN2_VITVI|nr:hypothetical protein CK203_052732 [Vitis vinifera]
MEVKPFIFILRPLGRRNHGVRLSVLLPVMTRTGLAGISNRESRQDGSSSKVRHFLKKLTKKASRINVENKASWASLPARAITGKTLNSSSEENMVPPSSSTVTHSGSQNHVSINSDTDPEDKFSVDEGMLCWNLLISRLFFDAKRSEEIKSFLQARIQVGDGPILPFLLLLFEYAVKYEDPQLHRHGLLKLTLSTLVVWYWILKRDLKFMKLDLQKGLVDSNLESSSVEEVTSDLLEGFEHYGKQLNLSEGTVNVTEHKDEGDPKLGSRLGKSVWGEEISHLLFADGTIVFWEVDNLEDLACEIGVQGGKVAFFLPRASLGGLIQVYGVGNRSRMKFWKDRWCNDEPLMWDFLVLFLSKIQGQTVKKEEDRVVWKEDSIGVFFIRGLTLVGDKLYQPFPFKDNLELMDSFEGGVSYLGGLLGKGTNFGSTSNKKVDVD